MGQDQVPDDRNRLSGGRVTPPPIARTKRLAIRTLERPDVDEIARWRPYTDPLLLSYNLPIQSPAERDWWFLSRSGDSTRREFVVETVPNGAMGRVIVGRIGLREINTQGSARLGIAIAAEYMNQGYGTEALAGFLDWFFGLGGFRRMVLDVSTANPHAFHIYQKLGFRHTGDFYRPLDTDAARAITTHRGYANLRPYLRSGDSGSWLIFHEMEITSDEWK